MRLIIQEVGTLGEDALQVECAAELSNLTAGSSGPLYPVADGSLRVEGDYTYYRPIIQMRIVDIEMNGFDEWGAFYAWRAQLEEI